MTNAVHRVVPDTTVQPVVFSHEPTEGRVTRAAAGRPTGRVQFSAPTPARTDRSRS